MISSHFFRDLPDAGGTVQNTVLCSRRQTNLGFSANCTRCQAEGTSSGLQWQARMLVDIVVAKKLCHPKDPELAIGAVTRRWECSGHLTRHFSIQLK